MAQVPECVVCLQPYDDYLHVPRVLACGHSFCELCLMQLQSAWQQPSTNKDSQDVAGALIRCPECSHRTRLPVGGQQSLPKNVEVLRLLPFLRKEADYTDERRAMEKKTGERGEVEDGGNNRGGPRRLVTEDGSRKSAERRSRGKERVDSNKGSLSDSWLVPCHLFSEKFNSADVRAWILPEQAIQQREDDDAAGLANHSGKRELLRGESIVEQHRLSSSVPVTLLRLEVSNCPSKEETLGYEQFVLKAWEECFHRETKTELLLLFRISLVCSRLCTLFGLWMNRRNDFFLVSQIPSHEIVQAWEMITNSRRLVELPDFELKGLKEEQETVLDDISSSTSEILQLESVMNGSSADSTTAKILARLGLMRGLCQALLEVHSQGLIFGLLSPHCLVLDRFDNLLLHVNFALKERYSLHEATRSCRGFLDTEVQFQGQGALSAQGQVNFQNSSNCWQYMSPEVLRLLIDNSADLEGPNLSAGNTSDRVQGRITCKSDVWSLGCILVELLWGKAPFDGLGFPEVLQRVLLERGRPTNILSLNSSLEQDDGEWVGAEKDSRVQAFKSLLSKCFEYDMNERPEVDALCLSLLELGSPNSIPKMMFTKHHLPSELAGSADQKYWILCLPGFVKDGFLDSWHTEKAELQESERLLDLLRLENGTQDHGRDPQPCGLELTGSLEGHLDFVTALVVCGDHLLSASFDKTIRVWSLEDQQLQQTLEGHSHVINALAVDQNTLRCFSGDSSGVICAWMLGVDTSSPLIATWTEHNDWRYTGVASLAVSADGILYNGSGDRTIKAWSLQNFVLLGTMTGHKSVVSTLLVDGELIYSGSWDGTIHVWYRNDHSPVAVLGGYMMAGSPLGGVRTLCMSDSFLFAGRDNGAVQDRFGGMKNA